MSDPRRDPPIVAWPHAGGWLLLATLAQRTHLAAVLDVEVSWADPITTMIGQPVTRESLELAVFICCDQLVIIDEQAEQHWRRAA